MIGHSVISRLPSQWIRRPRRGVSQAPTMTPSAFETWFEAMIRGRSAGIASSAPLILHPGEAARDRARERRRSPRMNQLASLRSAVIGRGRSRLGGRAHHVARSHGDLAGLPDRGHDRRHGLLEGIAVGHDVDRVGGRTKRRHGPIPVEVVTPAQLGEDGGRLGPGRVEAALLRSPSGAFLGRRVEEDLEAGVGQDDRADVPAGHHDPAAAGDRPLALEERRAQLADPGYLADRPIDLGAMDLLGDVDAIDQDAGQAALVIGGQLDLADEGDEGRLDRPGRSPAGGRAR